MAEGGCNTCIKHSFKPPDYIFSADESLTITFPLFSAGVSKQSNVSCDILGNKFSPFSKRCTVCRSRKWPVQNKCFTLYSHQSLSKKHNNKEYCPETPQSSVGLTEISHSLLERETRERHFLKLNLIACPQSEACSQLSVLISANSRAIEQKSNKNLPIWVPSSSMSLETSELGCYNWCKHREINQEELA